MTQRKLQAQAAVVLLLGTVLLASPSYAASRGRAIEQSDGCAVCYPNEDCEDGNQDDLNNDCLDLCGTDFQEATDCTVDMTHGNDCYPKYSGSSMVRCYYTGN